MARNRGFEVGSLPATMLAALGSYGVAVSGLAPLECSLSPSGSELGRVDCPPADAGCSSSGTADHCLRLALPARRAREDL
jgi:hypothetical protein